MAEVNVAATTELEKLLEAAASFHWLNLADLSSAKIVAALNRSGNAPGQESRGIVVSPAGIERVVSRTSARLAEQGRIFCLNENEPGRIGMLTADDSLNLAETAPRPLPAHSVRPAARHEDGTAGAADMLALDLNARDSLLILTTSCPGDYARAALQSAVRSGALGIEIAAGQESCRPNAATFRLSIGLPESVAPADRILADEAAQKLIVNLIGTLAMARTGKTGRIVQLDLRVTGAERQARNERNVMTGLPAELAQEVLHRRQNRLENAAENL